MDKIVRLFALIFFTVTACYIYAAESIQHGEAYVTRFSGTTHDDDKKTVIINLDGTVGSIINVSAPKSPPEGQHWIDEPQRLPIKAKDAGQIFGIAIDDSNPAVIYVTATSKFGLHRNENNSEWMPGMWGVSGGSGTIYRLRAANNYQPEVFTEITLNGRKNTGAALGNIAYDKQHKQLFVSDLETGMIHRIDAKTGKELQVFDHGSDGRIGYKATNEENVPFLTGVSFDPNSKANITQCPKKFDTSPECWNLADPRRRVWGLGVHTDKTGNTRLYYSAMVNKEDKQSSIWSIAINQDGSLDPQDVRYEFILPEHTGDNALSVSDIAFSNKNEMIVVENGRLRNLGLEIEEPFSEPFDARAFLYKLNNKGYWELQGRYDIGNLSKANNEYTNAAGGADFGVEDKDNNQFVWFSGDVLCSEAGPCYDPQTQKYTDTDEVHGLQGMSKNAYIPLNSEEPVYITETYMIDTDINIGADGKKLVSEAQKNDATKIGDVEIVKYISSVSTTPPTSTTPPIHNTQMSSYHDKYISSGHNKSLSTPYHDRTQSHYRTSSHETLLSHHRYGSHQRLDSHYRLWSHNKHYSHGKYNSHQKNASHLKFGSHDKIASHLKMGSHNKKLSHLKAGSHDKAASHLKFGSHDKVASHLKMGSHNKKLSHLKAGSHDKAASHLKFGSHDKVASHLKTGSHDKVASHLKTGSHDKIASHLKTGSHDKVASHLKTGSHDKIASHLKTGSHDKVASHLKTGSHNKVASHLKTGSHDKVASHLKTGSHDKTASHLKTGSHNKVASHLKTGSHDKTASHLKTGSHNKVASHLKTGSHDKTASHLKTGSHNKVASHLKTGSHDKTASHLKTGSHNKVASHLKTGSHNKVASHLKTGSHNKVASHLKTGSHDKTASHLKTGSHNKVASHLKTGSHDKTASHLKTGSHNKSASHLKQGSYNKSLPNLESHNKTASHLKQGSHNKSASHQKSGSQEQQILNPQQQ